MITLGALLQSAEKPKAASPVRASLAHDEEDTAQLLELRTETGPIYVRPSKWQRIRLQWAFRNFHVLPTQVLSRREQRLIEKLRRSAVVTPALPVASKAVLGVVEKERSKAPASNDRVFTVRTELSATKAFLVKAERLQRPAQPTVVKRYETGKAPTITKASELPFEQWGELGTLAAAGLVVILIATYGGPLLSGTRRISHAQTAAPAIQHAANDSKPFPVRLPLQPAATAPRPVSAATVALPKVEKPRRPVAPPQPVLAPALPEAATVTSESSTAESANAAPAPVPNTPVQNTMTDTANDTAAATAAAAAPIAATASPERRFVSELPPGHFAHPVVAQRDLVGELQLKALIAADGSVKNVTVVSGNPKLAEAGMRAVRQWHYRPYQVLGAPVEVETQIKMNFFGQDGMSITSVANTPASGTK